MIYEINRFIDDDHPTIQRAGWLLYNRVEQDGGLTLDETEQLAEILDDLAEELAEVPEVDELYNVGYADGYTEGNKQARRVKPELTDIVRDLITKEKSE
jgi:flagellar biosynthesis/type III secretory pathway protein FliH